MVSGTRPNESVDKSTKVSHVRDLILDTLSLPTFDAAVVSAGWRTLFSLLLERTRARFVCAAAAPGGSQSGSVR